LFTGKTPFKAGCDNDTFENVLEGKLKIPENVPFEVKDLIEKLLQPIPQNRLGAGC